MTDHPIPFTPWAAFMASWTWRLGEHVTVIGHTGSGKTTVLRALMPKRYNAGGAVNVLATKPRDEGLESWARHDRLTIVRSWPPRAPRPWSPPRDVLTPDGRRIPWKYRVMLWPLSQGTKLGEVDSSVASVMEKALHDMFWQGSWTIVTDELLYFSENLGLKTDLKTIWTQARSNNVSLVGATQRPVNIPLEAYSMATHLFVFRENDEVNLKRLQGIGGMSGRTLMDAVRTLPEHDVLYIDTRGRAPLVRTRVPVRTR